MVTSRYAIAWVYDYLLNNHALTRGVRLFTITPREEHHDNNHFLARSLPDLSEGR